MEDIIQLICPACGGKLNVSPNASLLVCQHCGTEHIVRRQGSAVTLESFARCPRCGRNDRAEKVSAILSSHTQNISSSEIQMRIVPNQYGQPIYQRVSVPKTLTQSSELAKKLAAPERPNPLSKPIMQPLPHKKSNSKLTFGIILLAISVIGVIFSILFASIGLTGNGDYSFLITILCLVPTILAGGVGILLTILGITSSQKLKSRYQQEYNQTIQRNKNIFQNWQETNQRIMQNYQNAVDRWNALYYCHRDDCVFIPEEGSSAPLESMKDYLFQAPPA